MGSFEKFEFVQKGSMYKGVAKDAIGEEIIAIKKNSSALFWYDNSDVFRVSHKFENPSS